MSEQGCTTSPDECTTKKEYARREISTARQVRTYAQQSVCTARMHEINAWHSKCMHDVCTWMQND
jgi:hypothetical protein